VRYRRLGRSDLEVSVIGLGTLAMGGRAYGEVDDATSIATIHRALDLGINLIDTADNYGFGHAEEVVGRAIRGYRSAVILATKGGTPWDAQGRLTNDCRADTITRAVEESLRRLQTGWIDLYQVHLPDPQTPYEETATALDRLASAGKIRYVGLSNFWGAEMEAWLGISAVAATQMPYNLLHRDVELEVLPACLRQGIGLIAYTPLLMGAFSGTFAAERTFPAGDHRRHYPQFAGARFEDLLRLVERLKRVAADHHLTVAQLALRWVVSRPGVTCAIPGAKSPGQVEENTVAAERCFTQQELHEIDRVVSSAGIQTARTMPVKVEAVAHGPRGRIGTLAMGIKVVIPERIQAGDVVQMDVVTGQILNVGAGDAR